jgi:hypothetical protein
MSPDTKRLADRVIKLLALANSTAFAAEAEAARAMAAELMRTHNISLGPGKPSQDTIEIRNYVPWAKGARWEGMIVAALDDLCLCACFFNGQTLDHYSLAGTIWNLDMLEYMLSEINRQRMRAWLDYKNHGGPDSFHKFCYGFAQALQEKIRKLTVAAAVNSNRDKLRLWYETNILGRKVESFSLASGRASSVAGVAAGGNASLHRGSLGHAQRQITYRR